MFPSDWTTSKTQDEAEFEALLMNDNDDFTPPIKSTINQPDQNISQKNFGLNQKDTQNTQSTQNRQNNISFLLPDPTNRPPDQDLDKIDNLSDDDHYDLDDIDIGDNSRLNSPENDPNNKHDPNFSIFRICHFLEMRLLPFSPIYQLHIQPH